MTTAIIAGGGIGGLTTALALHHHGIEPILLEQADALEGIGAGVQVGPNAVHVLAALNLVDELLPTAVEPRTMDVLDGRTGSTLVSSPLHKVAKTRYGQPYLNMHRGDLHDVLVRAVQERIPGSIRLSSRVESVTQDSTQVQAHLADGEVIVGDLLIGADGVHSAVRSHVFGKQTARFTGNVAYRMLVPRDALDPTPAPSITVRLGPHGHVVSYWVREGKFLNIVAVIEGDWASDGWRIPGDIEEVMQTFKDWDPRLLDIFDAATDVHKWALLDRNVPDRWTDGRIALLGDSCHAMRPYLAQGAGMAIEDAWVIANSLATRPDVADALRHYQSTRENRVARVHDTVAKNARVFHLDAAIPRFARNTLIRTLGLVSDTAFLRRFDWLYGYDATNANG